VKTYILLLGLSFFLSVFFTRLVRSVAHRYGWLDQPDDRKVHVVPTPRLGGVAIFLALFCSLLVIFPIHNAVTAQFKLQWYRLAPLPPAIIAIFLLGLADDIFGLKPYVKLAVEAGCALWIYYHGVHIGVVANPAGKPFDIGAWSLPVTVLWLVGISNAFNLVDGIDGLACGIALFATATLVIVSLFTGNNVITSVFIALAGATGGFLLFNFHPASIFLGDSGSLFLGFTLGALGIVWGQKSSLAVALVGPLLIFALPIADTGLAILRRFFSGKPLFTSDRDHIHHRLLHLGLSPRRVVLVLYVACFVFSAMTLLLVHTQFGMAVFILVPIFVGVWFLLSQLGYPEIGEINLTVRRGLLQQRDIISQRIQLRKITEAIGQAASFQELWAGILEIARIFEFDSAELILSPELRALFEPEPAREEMADHFGTYWGDGVQSAFQLHPEKFWQIELCAANSEGTSRLILRRALDKEELHLRMDPFVQQLCANVSKSIANFRSRA
jgi:UDP-GlcNAc:undecaprenyl-phosphate/decaprenyl-phosphate GlcNAc-1-phosphate transferase